MPAAYLSLLLEGVRRHGLSGDVEVLVSTPVAIRLAHAIFAHPTEHPDRIDGHVSIHRGLRVRWRHQSSLPSGTVSWWHEDVRTTRTVASLILQT